MHAGLLPFQLQADVGGAYATVSSHCILPLYLSTLYRLVEDLMLRAAASGGPVMIAERRRLFSSFLKTCKCHQDLFHN